MKLKLYKILNSKQPYENSIKISLISKYSELREILNIAENKTKFFYLDKEALYDIIYQEDKVIQIESKNYDYSFIYYIFKCINKTKEGYDKF